MEKCLKCGRELTDNDLIYWKCTKCGKVFTASLLKLKNLQRQKKLHPGQALLKCPGCGYGIDDGKERMLYKCPDCGSTTGGNLDNFVPVDDFGTNSIAEVTINNVVPNNVVSNNLISCPDCGKQISINADSCPNCGCREKAALEVANNVKSVMKNEDNFNIYSIFVKDNSPEPLFSYWVKIKYSGTNSFGGALDKTSYFSVNDEFEDDFLRSHFLLERVF